MLRPQSETELADMVRDATGPLSVRGGGTRGMTGMGEVLTTDALSGVVLYEPGALTIVAQAGTPVAELEAALASSGQRLPFEPMDHRALLGTEGTPTIGGVVAANVSGPRRIQVGACRDSLIGVRFVDGYGEVVRNGGRVMKNVTGYDLVKLMAGSHGTLGVMTEVAFKVLPAPEASATLSIADLTAQAAVAAFGAALRSPYEVSGAAWSGGTARFRVEGFADAVSYRAQALASLLAPHGEVSVEHDSEAQINLWQGIRDVASLCDVPGDVWRVSVKPTDGPNLLARLPEALAQLDWGGGLVWVAVPDGFDLRAAMEGIAGHATLIRATAAARAQYPAFHPEPTPVARLSEGVRVQFDPRGVLNTGLMG